MGSITKFPVSRWRQILNKRGSRSLNCIVSDRWLRVGAVEQPFEGFRGQVVTPIKLDVMTGGYDDDAPRKLCSLILTYEEIKALADKLAAEKDKQEK